MQARTVRDLMTTRVVTVHRAAPIREATRLLLTAHVSGLPVVDDDGKPVGVISKSDILDRIHNDEESFGLEKLFYRSAFKLHEPLAPGFHLDAELEGTVEEVMTPLTLQVTADTSIPHAARLMTFEGIHRVLVVDEGKMVGILTSMDIVRAVAGMDSQGGMAARN